MQMKKTHDAAMVIMERVHGARARFNDFIGSTASPVASTKKKIEMLYTAGHVGVSPIAREQRRHPHVDRRSDPNIEKHAG